jgi:hypothetical protein
MTVRTFVIFILYLTFIFFTIFRAGHRPIIVAAALTVKHKDTATIDYLTKKRKIQTLTTDRPQGNQRKYRNDDCPSKPVPE